MSDVEGLIGAGVPAAADLVKDVTVETFRADVAEASLTSVVLVDFWAEWCGPCKQLTPVLEKLVASYGGKVKLAKINVDKNQMLAQQMRVQSIPMVYAFAGGRPVDAFSGALPESQVKAFIERALKQAPAGPDDDTAEIEAALAEAEDMLAGGDAQTAAQIFSSILQHDAKQTGAAAGLARALIALGDLDAAKSVLEGLTDEQKKLPEVSRAHAALALAAPPAAPDELAGLQAQVEANPGDHQARLDLASALMARGDKEAAAEQLLESIKRDRAWNEGAARAKLVQIFEAVGLEDPFTIATRRRLSSLLFS
jgi:putative thioredoxin